MFISAIIMAVIGFITTKIWGVNLPKIISDIIIMLIIAVPVLLYAPSAGIEETSQFIGNYVETFVTILPGVIIGDVVGSLFSEFTDGL